MYREPSHRYTLRRRNPLYYNPWEDASQSVVRTPPWIRREPRTLQQLAIRESVRSGIPISSPLRDQYREQRAATQIQLSFQDYARRSEHTQCIDVLMNCHAHTKKRIINCLVEFMDYMMRSGQEEYSDAHGELIRGVINLLIQNRSEEESEMIFNFIDRATPQELYNFMGVEMFKYDKQTIQRLIDDTILRYIAPYRYEI